VSSKRTSTPSNGLRSRSKREADRLGLKQAERITSKKSAALRAATAKGQHTHPDDGDSLSVRKPPANAPSSKRSGRAPDREYAIGHGKPPPEYTWKPGQSGNSRGRPKGRKSEATIWKEILSRKVKVMIGGKLKEVTLQEAMQYRIAGDGVAGNIKSAGFVLNRSAIAVAGEIPISDSTEDDRAVLEAFARRIKDETSET
jgi:hypothetical protein